MKRTATYLGIILSLTLMSWMLSLQSSRKMEFQRALVALRSASSMAHDNAGSYQPQALGEVTLFVSSTSTQRITFNDLREYKVNRRSKSAIPEKLQNAVGKEIDIAGYMIPMNEALEVTEFMLVQIPFFGCCYSVPPEPNETVMVKMGKGKKTEYVYTPIRVKGTFSISETKIDGFVVSLYHIDGNEVKAASPNDRDVLQHQQGSSPLGR